MRVPRKVAEMLLIFVMSLQKQKHKQSNKHTAKRGRSPGPFFICRFIELVNCPDRSHELADLFITDGLLCRWK
jgi:hypothetical protein